MEIQPSETTPQTPRISLARRGVRRERVAVALLVAALLVPAVAQAQGVGRGGGDDGCGHAAPAPAADRGRHGAAAERAHDSTWSYLGQTRVGGPGRASSVIAVPASQGRIDRVMLAADGAPLHMRGVRVTYADGRARTVATSSRVAAGFGSVVIDLPPSRQPARSIEVLPAASRRRGPAAGVATVRAYGDSSFRRREPPRGPVAYPAAPVREPPTTIVESHRGAAPHAWILLGQTAVHGRAGRGVVRVDGTHGQVDRVQLLVSGRSLRIDSVTLTAASGRQLTLAVGQVVAAGGRTSVIDLPANLGPLRSVQVNCAPAHAAAASQARVSLLGLV